MSTFPFTIDLTLGSTFLSAKSMFSKISIFVFSSDWNSVILCFIGSRIFVSFCRWDSFFCFIQFGSSGVLTYSVSFITGSGFGGERIFFRNVLIDMGIGGG